MIIDSPIISGSQSASGPLTQIGDVYITGSLNVLGAINGSITGSITSASYATSAEFLDGLDSTSFVFTSSFNTFSGSAAGRITNLEAFSSSLDATFATDASVTASILVLSQSVQASQAALSSSYTITSASFAQTSSSLSIRTGNLEATSSTLVSASGSFAADSASLSTRLTGDEANITTLTNASSSFAAQSASLSTRITQDETNFTNLSSSFATTSGSISSRVTIIEGQDATTGSNVFTGPQFINQASNAIGFDSTASLYTDGGLRVSKDSFVSGTAYFNNVVVYGTSSIQYITSSQVNFGTNIITVNTDTPAVRFGGLAVFDSGSTQLTGSMLWDSEKNHWIYSNPSGSSYNSAMLMNGPRNTGSLGSEQGTTACALMMGQGGDHITSSMIYSYGNATCFYGTSYISSSGAACLASGITATQGIFRNSDVPAIQVFRDLDVTSVGSAGQNIEFGARNGATFTAGALIGGGLDNPATTGTLIFQTRTANALSTKLAITSTGDACFTSDLQVGGIYRDFAGEALLQTNTSCITLIGSAAAAAGRALNFLAGNNSRLCISTTGIATFTCQVCAPTYIGTTACLSGAVCASSGYITSGTTAGIRLKGNSTTGLDLQNDSGGGYIWNRDNTSLFFATNNTQRLVISETGAATFCCTVCAPSFIGGTLSGTTIYGSTAVCSPVGLFSGCVGVGTQTPQSILHAQSGANVWSFNGGCACTPYNNNSNGFYTNAGNISITSQYGTINWPEDYTTLSTTKPWWMLGNRSGTAGQWTLTLRTGYSGSGGLDREVIGVYTTGTDTARTIACIRLSTGAGVEAMKIDSAGAATFSSSVTAISSNFTTTSNTYTTQGTLSWNDVRGIIIRAKTASVYDFAVYSAAESAMIVNPTGTNNVTFPSGNIGIGTPSPGSRLTLAPPACTCASTIEFTNTDNAAITSHFSMTFAVNNSNTQSGRAIVFSGGGKGYGNQCSNIATFTSDDKVANFFGTICAPVAVIGSSCSPSAGINFLGTEGYRQKWLITQGRYRFCFGTQDFYGTMFIEVYATNYNQGTSELRNVKAAVNLRYGLNRSIGQIYNLGGSCIGGYLTNGIGLVWCNISDTVGDLIFTNAGSLQPDSVLATELQFLSNGSNLINKFYRMCYVDTLYDTTNPYV